MAKVTNFHVMRGVTLEYQGHWLKFECGIDIAPDAGDDMKAIKKRAWDTVEQELERELLAARGES